MIEPKAEFPVLFGTTELPGAPVDATFRMLEGEVDERLLASVYVVAFVAESCLMVRFESSEWALLGGTRERGEGAREALARELREEAGARLLSYQPFAVLSCHSRTSPLHAHLPHPDYECLLGFGDAELVCEPTLADEGEVTVAVDVVPVTEAIGRYRASGQVWEAELCRLAATLRAEQRQ